MRVVCDNCGAVYKIADSKLSKDVNKATCKRCGHKIVIYKPGYRPPQEGKAAIPAEPEAEERTVIKSVEGLDKISKPSGKVPAIGSLTAELRAISLPGVKPVAPATPAPLGPNVGAPPPPKPLPPVGAPPLGAPPKVPSVGIPPKDSPPTAHYGGPRPSLPQVPKVPAVPVAPPVPGEGDKTRPMTQPPAPSSGGVAVVGGGAKRPAPPPSVKTPVVSPAPPKPVAPRPPPPPKPQAAPKKPAAQPQAAPKPAAAPAGTGSAELGVVAGLGAVGLLGALAAAFFPPPTFSAGIALAAFAGATCLLLPIMSQRGRKKGQVFASVFLGLIIGGAIGFIAHTRAAEMADDGSGELSELPPPVAPDPTPAPIAEPTGTTTEGDEPTPEEGAGLSEEEKEEARKFSGSEIAGLGGTDPTPAPKPDPTPAPRPDPTPAPKKVEKAEEPTPKESGRRPVGPGKPPEEKSTKASAGSSGPSPFVVDTIIRNNANIQRCFALEKARGTEMSGKIYLKFSIAPDGKVSRARITTSRFAGTALDQCVSKEVNQLQFPPFDGESQNVRYPFNVL